MLHQYIQWRLVGWYITLDESSTEESSTATRREESAEDVADIQQALIVICDDWCVVYITAVQSYMYAIEFYVVNT